MDEIEPDPIDGAGEPTYHPVRMDLSSTLAARLHEARQAWGMDEVALAQRSGLDRAAVDEALRGEADAADLDAVARAMGGDLDALLAGRPFWRAPGVAFKERPAEVDAGLLRTAMLRSSSAARDLRVVLDLLGLDPSADVDGRELLPTPLAVDVTAQSEEFAARVRRALRTPLAPITSLRRAMLQLGVATVLTDLGGDDPDAMLWRDEDGRSVAVANVRARNGKLATLRMIFAHELCHALFDGTRLQPLGVIDRRGEGCDDVQRRANAFAAHLLAPREAVESFLRTVGHREGERPSAPQVRALSEHFGIGVEAAASHLVSCGHWERADLTRHRNLYTRAARGPDNGEMFPTTAEEAVSLERRGLLLNYATEALTRGFIGVARWREFVGLTLQDDWRALLIERGVDVDVEQRTPM